ncbi:MAG: uroporphyrinogen decarboxylase [Oligoflexia bacterium]|nr:uroporphyrinogen decarboxylase [Oligoflexia bacterium]
MGLYTNRTQRDGKTQVPVWFMRQAGRYHSHYQNIRKDSDFVTMCKQPDLACEITMGPMRDFKFDAAILFSDILYPLELFNMGLVYNPGPKMDMKLDSVDRLKEMQPNQTCADYYKFQADALTLLKKELPQEKTLLGFVGAPFTLYTYAVEGGHSGNLTDSKKGFYDGRWQGFLELLIPTMIENIEIQIKGGADGICLFDTAVGEMDLNDFKAYPLQALKTVTKAIKAKYPDIPLTYYSKLTHVDYLRAIEDDNLDVLGVDWRTNLPAVLKEFSKDYYIQGNLDPSHLHLPWELLEGKLEKWWASMNTGDLDLSKWIAGLGHGVLQHTPEENVRNTVKYIQDNFIY